MARMAAYWSLAILAFYGCASLHTELVALFPSLGEPMGGIHVPVLGIDLSPAFAIAALLLVTALWLLYRWLERPKYADLLIETESELRKVTWPTVEETINGSVVVIVCVVFLMAFMAGTDWFLGRVARTVLLGRG